MPDTVRLSRVGGMSEWCGLISRLCRTSIIAAVADNIVCDCMRYLQNRSIVGLFCCCRGGDVRSNLRNTPHPGRPHKTYRK